MAGAMILTGLLTVFLLWPKYQNLQQLSLRVQAKEMELKSKEDYYSHLKQTSRLLEGYREGLSKINSALPRNPSLASLFDYFQKISSQTGLLLEKIGFESGSQPITQKEEQGLPSVKEMGLRLSLSGSYPDFKNFLSVIEKSARLFEVKNISFSVPTEEGEPFSFEVQIKTHRY